MIKYYFNDLNSIYNWTFIGSTTEYYKYIILPDTYNEIFCYISSGVYSAISRVFQKIEIDDCISKQTDAQMFVNQSLIQTQYKWGKNANIKFTTYNSKSTVCYVNEVRFFFENTNTLNPDMIFYVYYR